MTMTRNLIPVFFCILNECRKLAVKEKGGKKQVKAYFTTHSVLIKFVNVTCMALVQISRAHWSIFVCQ